MRKYSNISIMVVMVLFWQSLLGGEGALHTLHSTKYPFQTRYGMGTNALRPRAAGEREGNSVEVSNEARDFLKDYIIKLKADDGVEFIFRYCLMGKLKSCMREDVVDILSMDVYARDSSGKEESIAEAWLKIDSRNNAVMNWINVDRARYYAIEVEEEWRKRYSGIGRTMMSLLMQLAYLRGLKAFYLERVSWRSEQFFLNLGFIHCGIFHKPYTTDLYFPLSKDIMVAQGLKFPRIGVTKKRILPDFEVIPTDEREILHCV